MKKTVLLVEDSADIRLLVAIWLRSAGFEIVEVNNGQEALLFLENNPRPDIIVLDVRMPVMDGHQFRAAQEKDLRLRDIPIVLYTCEPNIAQLARQLHADGFVSKCDSPRRVLEEVQRCQH